MKYLVLSLLLISSACFANVSGGVDNPSMYIEEQDGTPSNVYWKLIFPNNCITDNGDNTASLNTVTEAHVVANYLRLNGSNSPMTGDFDSVADTDGIFHFGRVALGYNGVAGFSNYATISHYDTFNATDYALTQDQGGWTYLNAALISNLDFCIGGVSEARLNGGGFSVKDNPLLFGTYGSEDVEIMRLGARNLGIYSDYGDVDVDITGTLGAGVSTLSTVNFGSSTGVSATATNGVLTLTSLKSGGNLENFLIDLENQNNQVYFRSNSGVTTFVYQLPDVPIASNGGTFRVYSNDSMAINKGGSIVFGGADTGTSMRTWAVIAGRKENAIDSNYSAYLQFATRPNGGSITEAARITSNQNFLIGTTDFDGTPAAGRLIVKGTTNDGTTNAQVWRDSDEANVATLDTNGNLTLGGGENLDNTITFNGDSNDGVITWQEDEDTFAMACNLQLTDAGSKFGVGVAPSYPIHVQDRTNPSGGIFDLYVDWQGVVQSSSSPIAIGGYFKNTGSTANDGSHGIGIWGHYEDVSTSHLMGIGTEGKVTAYGDGPIYSSLVGYSRFFNSGGTGPTGRIEGAHIKVEIARSEGGATIASGVGTGVYIEPILGGAAATKYSFLGHDKVQVSASEGSTDTVYLSRNSSSADLTVEGNDNLTITVPSSQHVIIHDNATSVSPSSSGGVDLGMTSYEWGALYQKGILVHTPSATQVIDAAGDTILANAGTVILSPGSVSDYTLTSTPTIADGYPGQVVYLIIAPVDTKTVTIQDQDTLANSNIQLPWSNLSIGAKDVVKLLFNGTDWCLAERQDN